MFSYSFAFGKFGTKFIVFVLQVAVKHIAKHKVTEWVQVGLIFYLRLVCFGPTIVQLLSGK